MNLSGGLNLTGARSPSQVTQERVCVFCVVQLSARISRSADAQRYTFGSDGKGIPARPGCGRKGCQGRAGALTGESEAARAFQGQRPLGLLIMHRR